MDPPGLVDDDAAASRSAKIDADEVCLPHSVL
jgi:hypothetical protein